MVSTTSTRGAGNDAVSPLVRHDRPGGAQGDDDGSLVRARQSERAASSPLSAETA